MNTRSLAMLVIMPIDFVAITAQTEEHAMSDLE